jgi:hypothetical protein
MTAHVIPQPNAAVRVVVRGGPSFYGEVLAAKVNGGRVAFSVWGTGRSVAVHPDDIESIEVVSPTSSEVAAIADRQRRITDFAKRCRPYGQTEAKR